MEVIGKAAHCRVLVADQPLGHAAQIHVLLVGLAADTCEQVVPVLRNQLFKNVAQETLQPSILQT